MLRRHPSDILEWRNTELTKSMVMILKIIEDWEDARGVTFSGIQGLGTKTAKFRIGNSTEVMVVVTRGIFFDLHISNSATGKSFSNGQVYDDRGLHIQMLDKIYGIVDDSVVPASV